MGDRRCVAYSKARTEHIVHTIHVHFVTFDLARKIANTYTRNNVCSPGMDPALDLDNKIINKYVSIIYVFSLTECQTRRSKVKFAEK